MPQFEVTTLDLVVLGTYVIGTRILFGWYYARKTKGEGSESYFLAGRGLRWPIIGLSFYVANMSGSTFVALPASGYNDGIAVYNYEWLPALILVFFALFMLPLFLRAEIFTAPEYLERRFGRPSRLAFSGFLLIANVFIDAAAALYAGAIIAGALFPEIPLEVTVGVTAAIAGVYIAFGGLGAVVINDALQAALIMVGGAVISIMAYLRIPSWAAVRDASPDKALHLILPAGDPIMPWPGLLTGVLIVGTYFWCTNQFIMQRTLGAKSLEHARLGSLFAGFLKLPNLFILILPGVFATYLYPDLTNPDLVFPTMVFDLLPVGVRGLMLAALAAAILSSLEAIFNSAATLFTMDFVRTWRDGVDDERLARIGRWATLGFMVAAAAWAPQIASFPTLWQYLQSVLSYVTPPVVAVFLLGVFWPRATGAAALATLAAGIPLGVAGWILLEIAKVVRVPYLYASGIVFSGSIVLMVTVSLATRPPPAEQVEAHVWSKRLWRDEAAALSERPFYANYRYLSVVLVALTAAVVAWWW